MEAQLARPKDKVIINKVFKFILLRLYVSDQVNS